MEERKILLDKAMKDLSIASKSIINSNWFKDIQDNFKKLGGIKPTQ